MMQGQGTDHDPYQGRPTAGTQNSVCKWIWACVHPSRRCLLTSAGTDWLFPLSGPCFYLCLCKAKESGFLFGAYTHCSWPENEDGDRVADLTGQSFLFSLTNGPRRPVRFSLHTKDAAIAVFGVGVSFGYPGCNFMLNCQRAASDDDRGNTAWLLDERRTYQPDDGDFTRDAKFFAGSQYFAASDIEVFEL